MTTVAGTYLTASGQPASGYIRFTPMPSGLLDTGEQVTCQPVYAMLDTSGSFTIDLFPDDDYINLTGESVYEVAEFITDCRRCWYLFLADDTAVDLPSRYPGDSAGSAAILPVPGPQGPEGAEGPQGPQGPQGDPGAPVTVQDPATGRLQIAGVEMGSTQWRDIGASLLNGWAMVGGKLLLRRDGDRVTLLVSYRLTGAAATSDVLLTLPAGFQVDIQAGSYFNLGALMMDTNNGIPGKTSTSMVPVGCSLNAPMGATRDQLIVPSRNIALTGILRWPTSAAWPATLPGQSGLLRGD